MSLQDGLQVNAQNTNSAYVSKTVNSDIISIPSLKNNDVGSGAHVINPQKAINKNFDTVGIADENDANAKVYANNNFITDGDSHKTALEKLDLAVFNGVGAGVDNNAFVEIILNAVNSFSVFEILYENELTGAGSFNSLTLNEVVL